MIFEVFLNALERVAHIGGIGGYIMRVYKSVTLGTLLQQHYDHAARVDTANMSNTLERIEKHLKDQVETSTDEPVE